MIHQSKIITSNHQSPEGIMWVGISEKTFQLINYGREGLFPSFKTCRHLCQWITVLLTDLICQFKNKHNRPLLSVLLVSPSGECFHFAICCCQINWDVQTRGLHGSTRIQKPKVRPEQVWVQNFNKCLRQGSGLVFVASGLRSFKIKVIFPNGPDKTRSLVHWC